MVESTLVLGRSRFALPGGLPPVWYRSLVVVRVGERYWNPSPRLRHGVREGYWSPTGGTNGETDLPEPRSGRSSVYLYRYPLGLPLRWTIGPVPRPGPVPLGEGVSPRSDHRSPEILPSPAVGPNPTSSPSSVPPEGTQVHWEGVRSERRGPRTRH